MTANKLGQKLFSGTIMVLAVLAPGCVASPDELDALDIEEVGEATQPLYAKSTALWGRGEKINVCWLPGGSTADKALVQSAITTSWQANANIWFVGWGDCPASGFQGIQITPGDFNAVSGGLGKQADGISDLELDFTADPETVWTQCTANGLNRSACIQATAIHEFGHSLAFAHEQNRPDNSECFDGVGEGSMGDLLLGPHDMRSIMSYCADATWLSIGDIYGVQVVYGIAPALAATAAEMTL